MGKFNTKTLVQYGAGFMNLRFMFKLKAGRRSRRKRTFFIFEGRHFTYGEVYRESHRYADFFTAERKRRLQSGTLSKNERLSVGIYMENRPQYIFTIFGAALSNTLLFALNTGFRGETISAVINQARVSLCIIDSSTAHEMERIIPQILSFGPGDIYYAADQDMTVPDAFQDLEAALSRPREKGLRHYRPTIINTSPFIIIYTSGMTGMPKGVPCTQIKIVGAGLVTRIRIPLKKRDRGYICMPLFHSNSIYLGVIPLLFSGASFVLKRRFSASAFEEDMLEHGVTYMNYVGQPLHYIITAMENKYGGGDAVEKALSKNMQNHFRMAHGNGASAVDRQKLIRYLGMEHIYELYGSTEAAINTVNKPGDPPESLGRAPKSVIIINEEGRPCPPGVTDDCGRLINYAEAVGEISKRIKKENVFFDGYFNNAEATDKKFSDGYYHSGDLGHIRVISGKRYLYFNGRTDDWIRKDGENFSAESVLQYACSLPGVEQAIAYGVPCEVSDEKVMITVQMEDGKDFNPQAAFDWFTAQQKEGGMDPKWMPDYIRLVESFSLTNTQKIIIRPYKRQHFNIEKTPDMTVYYRLRGDETYRPLTGKGLAEIRDEFRKTGRQNLLDE